MTLNYILNMIGLKDWQDLVSWFGGKTAANIEATLDGWYTYEDYSYMVDAIYYFANLDEEPARYSSFEYTRKNN